MPRSLRNRPRLCEVLGGVILAAASAALTVAMPELAPPIEGPPLPSPNLGAAAAAAAAVAAINALRVWTTRRQHEAN